MKRPLLTAGLLATLVVACLRATLAASRGWQVEVSDKASALQHAQQIKAERGQDATKKQAQLAEWWSDYKGFFNKEYNSAAEEAKALLNFKAAMDRVDAVNSNADVPHWASGNIFSDLDFDTFKKRYLGARLPKATSNRKLLATNTQQHDLLQHQSEDGHFAATAVQHRQLLAVPDSVNWTAAGKVTAVKNQGSYCACDWAYAPTATLESAYLIAYNKTASSFPVNLSEQQITSCAPYSDGCYGGDSGDALSYASTNSLALESQWPFTNLNTDVTSACYSGAAYTAATQPGKVVQTSQAYISVAPNSYTALQQAVAQQPVVVYLSADQAFVDYAGGVFNPAVYSTDLNVAVAVTGYSISGRTWSLKLSWGAGWGEAGYMRIYMGYTATGICGMYQFGISPPLLFNKSFNSTTSTAIAAGTM